MPTANHFKDLHRDFEKKQTDLNVLEQKQHFGRYLLIRSLDKDHLKELLQEVG